MCAPPTPRRWRSTAADLQRGSWPGRIQPMQSQTLSTDMAPNDPSDQDAAVAALLRRVAATAGVHMYEMELCDDFEYVCQVWIGQALESLLGGVPEGMDKEAAWEACIHPDDRATYEASVRSAAERRSDRDGVPAGRVRRRHPLGLGALHPQAGGRRQAAGGRHRHRHHRPPPRRAGAGRGARPSGAPGLPRSPHRPAQPRAVPGASGRRAGPRRPRRLLRGRAVHRPGRVQAGERCPRPRRR